MFDLPKIKSDLIKHGIDFFRLTYEYSPDGRHVFIISFNEAHLHPSDLACCHRVVEKHLNVPDGEVVDDYSAYIEALEDCSLQYLYVVKMN